MLRGVPNEEKLAIELQETCSIGAEKWFDAQALRAGAGSIRAPDPFLSAKRSRLKQQPIAKRHEVGNQSGRAFSAERSNPVRVFCSAIRRPQICTSIRSVDGEVKPGTGDDESAKTQILKCVNQ